MAYIPIKGANPHPPAPRSRSLFLSHARHSSQQRGRRDWDVTSFVGNILSHTTAYAARNDLSCLSRPFFLVSPLPSVETTSSEKDLLRAPFSRPLSSTNTSAYYRLTPNLVHCNRESRSDMMRVDLRPGHPIKVASCVTGYPIVTDRKALPQTSIKEFCNFHFVSLQASGLRPVMDSARNTDNGRQSDSMKLPMKLVFFELNTPVS
ncbi:hypothetical protein BC827DRAFT_364360 [Russula dissimulans]|nr:hypothetical protein BC827DRAFT_364360 [Russula dissimulans]